MPPQIDLAVTALVRGRGDSGDGLDVLVHAAPYTSPVFGETGARVAVAGRGRDAAAAKYAPWVRQVSLPPFFSRAKLDRHLFPVIQDEEGSGKDEASRGN